MTENVVWRNGDLNDFVTNLRAWEDRVTVDFEVEMTEVLDDALDDMHKGIEGAVTPTGLARESGEVKSRFGSTNPGRIDSGNMDAGVHGEVTNLGNGELEAKWGWPDPKRYFLYQEDGTGRIAPMHALLTSFIKARENLATRLRNRGARVE